MRIYKNKIFRLIVALFIIGILLGIVSYFFIDKDSLKDLIYNYFNMFNNDIKYKEGVIRSIIYNYKYLFIIYISGIILLSYLIVPLLIILNGISISLLFITIITSFKLKGLILCLILLFPCVIINNIIYILSSYYSINISNKILICIKQNKSINIKLFFKNYIIIYGVFIILLLLSSLFEIFISSNLIKYVI